MRLMLGLSTIVVKGMISQTFLWIGATKVIPVIVSTRLYLFWYVR
jgi:hypothetical protein